MRGTSRGARVVTVLAALGVASASAAVADAPARPRKVGLSALQEFSRSTGQLWTNFKVARAIRTDIKAGAAINFADHFHLTRGTIDRGKVFQLIWMASVIKWSTPLVTIFVPSLLPSTFETSAAAAARLEADANVRKAALLELLQKADAGKLPADMAIEALSCGSKAKAFALLSRGGMPLKDLPLPIVHCASKGLAGPQRIFPRFLHMKAIRGKLRNLEQGDAALRVTRLEALPRATLAEACNERAIRVGSASSKALKGAIDEWLALTATTTALPREVADTARLALLAINAVSATRKAFPEQAPVTHAFHTRGGV
ncbi:hypothetical protein KFE25_003999 [Diacronema lutheri]|uniref:Letm1 RBD domain-containing protein n=1 Tax=Diacronema lutheri TaxID=2081491 RepID=A0A8J5XDY7_DIALT|nr:hypothetical protein KFE25_003999 [Diacronema lutheri]